MATFDKACACLGLRLKVVDIDVAGLAIFTEDKVDRTWASIIGPYVVVVAAAAAIGLADKTEVVNVGFYLIIFVSINGALFRREALALDFVPPVVVLSPFLS